MLKVKREIVIKALTNRSYTVRAVSENVNQFFCYLNKKLNFLEIKK